MIRTYKYRLYPNRVQTATLETHLELCRELYNAALQERIESYKVTRRGVGRFDQQRQLKEIRQIRPEFQDIRFNVLTEILLRLDKAFRAFFRRVKRGEKPGFPRFKGRSHFHVLSFTNQTYRVNGSRLVLGKIGGIKINLHRPLPEILKTCIVKKVCGAWYAHIFCDVPAQLLPNSNKAIGVDVGLESFAYLSDGTRIENPRWYRNAQAKLRIAQRRVARRIRASRRRYKAVFLLQKLHETVGNKRRDFQHKLSRKIVSEFGLIAVEDLNIKGLSTGMFSKQVADAGWAQFIHYLAYKAENAGRQLIFVAPQGTSQTCLCGAIVKKRLSDREHVCTACGLVAPRDFVSAQVILQRALNAPSDANVGRLVPCVV